MVASRSTKESRRVLEQRKRAVIALEDAIYAVRRLRPDGLEAALEVVRESIEGEGQRSEINTYQSPDPNKHFLIGVLPRLLMDRDLFPSNEDVAQFSREALRFSIPRYEKVAREDLIGKIVCRADSLDDGGLKDLVQALGVIVNDKESIAILVERKRSGSFSWNEAIQENLGRA